jgi:hypothetical protein
MDRRSAVTLGTGLVMVVRGVAATLAGAVLAALVVGVAVASAPDLARSPGFLRVSGVVAVLVYGALGLAGTRFGGRPLRDLDAWREWTPLVACCGPLLAGLPIQVGVAATGQPLVSALSSCALIAGAGLGAWTIRRRAGLTAGLARGA